MSKSTSLKEYGSKYKKPLWFLGVLMPLVFAARPLEKYFHIPFNMTVGAFFTLYFGVFIAYFIAVWRESALEKAELQKKYEEADQYLFGAKRA